ASRTATGKLARLPRAYPVCRTRRAHARARPRARHVSDASIEITRRYGGSITFACLRLALMTVTLKIMKRSLGCHKRNTRNRRWWALGALAVALLTVGLDMTILNVG